MAITRRRPADNPQQNPAVTKRRPATDPALTHTGMNKSSTDSAVGELLTRNQSENNPGKHELGPDITRQGPQTVGEQYAGSTRKILSNSQESPPAHRKQKKFWAGINPRWQRPQSGANPQCRQTTTN